VTTSSGNIKVTVVCPFFNEEAIIEKAALRTIENLRQQFAGGDWELIAVNDGSVDRSVERILKVVDGIPNVRVLSLPYNQGRGRALKSGIDLARGDLIVTTEIDCSWGDDIARRLADELAAHPSAHVVIASPHLKGGGLVNVNLRRTLLTKLGNFLIRRFFASGITMNTGMTRIYRREIIQPLVVYENGKEFHLEVLLKLVTLGFRVREIPATITWQDHKLMTNPAGKRKSSTRIFKTINSHLRFIAIAQPVRYFAWLAVCSFFVGAIFMIISVWNLLVGAPAAFFAMIGLILFLFCLMFVGFSVAFFQMRENMRENWVRSYPAPHPPTSAVGKIVCSPGERSV
jgi:dolichol-phosphate mannosyltransferase